jgi:fumarylpyruvate hydrolase
VSELIFALPVASLPIVDSQQRFAVGRVFCLGRNYPWQAPLAGGPSDPPRSVPLFFMKPASAVIEARGEVAYPSQTEEFCPEIELVVAIGAAAWEVSVDQALAHVWGYGAGLDLTRRDLQMAAKAIGQPWEAAKAFDGSAPVTALVPASRIGHPREGALWLAVNGVERQRADLQAQIWSVAEVISQLSHSVRLLPGDLIMTGTPPGVEALRPGDEIHAAIDGVAELRVRVGPRRP